ncbi:hypothetical protein [Nocardioides dongkuii]|nr:hypothetical protein [Nocardioides dongkuii]
MNVARSLRSRSSRGARTLCPFGGIPVEYKGGSVPPPDQRRSYN